jgi:hypothetical protein
MFNEPLCSEDIDRSYGNTPYFFYNHYSKEEEIKTEDKGPLQKEYRSA